MRICQVTYTGFGGLGSVVFSLIAGAHRNIEWSVAFIGDQPLDASYKERCDQLGVPCAAFQSTPGRPYAAWARLVRWLGTTKPDVVICHSINSILACRWYAWLHRAKVVCVEHTPNQVKTRPEKMASKLGMLLADHVIVLTPEYLEELRQSHGPLFRAGKVSIAPNGIDLAVFRPAPRRPAARKALRMGMAARFSFSKRQDLLVDVVQRVAEMRPELSVELTLAGDGDELERVKARAASAGGSVRFHFEGLLSEPEVAGWLRTLDLYVHATEGETLSTSLLQAMATGLPIVASDIPGVRNLLGGGNRCGLCVPNTVDAFAEAIVKLVDEEEAATEQGQRALRQVQENYSLEAMWQNYSRAISR